MVTRALGLVILTPRALALARMVTRFLEETAVAILVGSCPVSYCFCIRITSRVLINIEGNILCGERAVVHEQKIDILRVVNEEGLVAGRHHMSSLLIASIANLIPTPVN